MTVAALIITSDPSIADDLLRLAAAASAEAEVVRSAFQARDGWSSPPLVLVGGDMAHQVAALPRRPGVVLVTRPSDAEGHQRALHAGAQDLALLPDHEPWLIDRLASAAEPPAGQGTVVCVCGARGGVGGSVLAAALGLTAARAGRRTLLVDGDPYGGGLDLVLGLEEQPGARWPDLASRRGRLSATTLREALPGLGDLSVLSWRPDEPVSLPEEPVRSVLDAAVRGYDLTIVDIPRQPSDLTRTCLGKADVVYLLVPCEIRATLAVGALKGAFTTADVRLVVTTSGSLTPDVLAQALEMTPAAVLHQDRRVLSALDAGELPHALGKGPLADLCGHLLAGLAPRREAA
ncbi:septum site-determining protein Ssd [Actinomadura macrotermitis]|uniref:Rv3660c-like CheY-like N-terminal domain-containing protein n=1 Tax=Actinomadura macrotermitis TaxID=2585200 RepID=A0A7K0BXV9_9ACTN|nr:septum site-determining protein Ssd [Actinomadura macrotermitis]MQY05474.1 hypothetical protein [Actinomadura macrotermitis]